MVLKLCESGVDSSGSGHVTL